MITNEFILMDRVQKIKQIINQYGEENFYLSFSGGKDSTVLSALVDLALPNNQIPRVFADTGIDLNIVRDFVFNVARSDDRFVIIKPSVPIKQMLEKDGYPFKSKKHAKKSAKTAQVINKFWRIACIVCNLKHETNATFPCRGTLRLVPAGSRRISLKGGPLPLRRSHRGRNPRRPHRPPGIRAHRSDK